MKITGLQENIKQSLLIVNHVANKNINLPILNNVLLEAKEGKIKMVTTNLEIGITNVIRGKIEAEGSFTVDAKMLTDYISLLPNKKVEIELKNNELLINCENYKTKIKGQTAEEFPLIPLVESENTFSADVNEFKKAMAQAVFAAAPNDSRQELSGVLFRFKGNELILAATDSYRLAEKKIKINNPAAEEKQVIIPAKTIQEVLRIISGMAGEGLSEEREKEIKFQLSDNQVLFIYSSMELVSRLIEGQYPDYEQIIPQNSKTKAFVPRQELVKAVKAASLFANKGVNDINIDFPVNQNKAVISSSSGQSGENITEIAAEVTGDDNGAVVNYRYLIDGLNCLESENVRLEVVDGNTPCVLKPEKADDYLYIIMPIKQ